MNFERLLLTKNSEFYRFSRDYVDIAYLLIFDSFSKANSSFGEQFFDSDFEPRDNHIIVKVGLLRNLNENEKNEINSFVDGLLSFKPSVDYVIDFFKVPEELEFDYPTDEGFVELIEKINKMFDLNREIVVHNIDSFNNILQK